MKKEHNKKDGHKDGMHHEKMMKAAKRHEDKMHMHKDKMHEHKKMMMEHKKKAKDCK